MVRLEAAKVAYLPSKLFQVKDRNIGGIRVSVIVLRAVVLGVITSDDGGHAPPLRVESHTLTSRLNLH